MDKLYKSHGEKEKLIQTSTEKQKSRHLSPDHEAIGSCRPPDRRLVSVANQTGDRMLSSARWAIDTCRPVIGR